MNYTILSINDDRLPYKQAIHRNVTLPELEVECFNAHADDPYAELKSRGLDIKHDDWKPMRGELGVWLSNLNAWQACVNSGEPLIVFEDDAVVEPDFMDGLDAILRDLPDDYGFLTLWVPFNQYWDWNYDVSWDRRGFPHIKGHVNQGSLFEIGLPNVAKVYQGYGGVALLYSPAGAQALLDVVESEGLYNPCDCQIYLAAHAGWVNGYAPRPGQEPVKYDWTQETTTRIED